MLGHQAWGCLDAAVPSDTKKDAGGAGIVGVSHQWFLCYVFGTCTPVGLAPSRYISFKGGLGPTRVTRSDGAQFHHRKNQGQRGVLMSTRLYTNSLCALFLCVLVGSGLTKPPCACCCACPDFSLCWSASPAFTGGTTRANCKHFTCTK